MKKRTLFLLIVVYLHSWLNASAQGWEKSFIDSVGHGMGRCAIQTMGGGFYFTSDPANIGMGQTAKLDSAGNVIWSSTIGGWSVVESSDTGCVVASTDYFNFNFRKLNSTGIIQWTKSYSFGGQHHMMHIGKVSDGNYISCGAADSNGIILKLDMNGDSLWSYSSSNQNWDTFEEAVETFDKGFVIVNRISPNNGTTVRILKIDSVGNYVWAKTYPNMWSETICQTPDSGFVISAGLAGVSKLDKMGNLLYTTSVGSNTVIRSIKLTTDGGCIATGELTSTVTDDDIILIKLDDSCNIQWAKTFYSGPFIDYAETVNVLADGGYIVCGSINYSGPTVSAYLIRTDSLGNTAVGIGDVIDKNESMISINPSPCSFETVCKFKEVHNAILSIYNYYGECISQIDQINGSSVTISCDNLKSGMYFVQLTEMGKVIATEKLIFVE